MLVRPLPLQLTGRRCAPAGCAAVEVALVLATIRVELLRRHSSSRTVRRLVLDRVTLGCSVGIRDVLSVLGSVPLSLGRVLSGLLGDRLSVGYRLRMSHCTSMSRLSFGMGCLGLGCCLGFGRSPSLGPLTSLGLLTSLGNGCCMSRCSLRHLCLS